MTSEDLADLHAAAMSPSRGWSADEIDALIRAPGAISICATDAFALGRVTLDEAELLTIAVAPRVQGGGLGSACLERFQNAARARGARQIFLEVAETNAAARSLYARAGYAQVGRRTDYYTDAKGRAVDALVLRLNLLP